MRSARVSTLIVGLTLLLTGNSDTSPLKDPKRVINGRTVDLTPLFHWWAKRGDDRPLAAWAHVSGEVVGTNGFGWTVSAHLDEKEKAAAADKSGSDKIILRNPPWHDRAAFDQLVAKKKSLEQQKSAFASQADQAHAQLQDLSQDRKAARQRHVSARSLNGQSAKLKEEEKNAKAQMKPLDTQLAELDKQLKQFGSADHYVVDCFALRTGEKINGLPVYDHGTVFH